MSEGVDPQELLARLRWDVDSLITNYDGERVWLKAATDENGKRIGITDCCLAECPCEHHSKVAADRNRQSNN